MEISDRRSPLFDARLTSLSISLNIPVCSSPRVIANTEMERNVFDMACALNPERQCVLIVKLYLWRPCAPDRQSVLSRNSRKPSDVSVKGVKVPPRCPKSETLFAERFVSVRSSRAASRMDAKPLPQVVPAAAEAGTSPRPREPRFWRRQPVLLAQNSRSNTRPNLLPKIGALEHPTVHHPISRRTKPSGTRKRVK